MKKTFRKLFCLAMAVGCFSLAGVTRAEVNRASELLGREVCDQQNEHLGRIRDIVFDLKTERVSYAVMAVNVMGISSFKEKLLAVPLEALTVSADGKNLVMRAEKEKIDLAAGIDPKHWPSVGSPAWGAEPFWQKDEAPSSLDK